MKSLNTYITEKMVYSKNTRKKYKFKDFEKYISVDKLCNALKLFIERCGDEFSFTHEMYIECDFKSFSWGYNKYGIVDAFTNMIDFCESFYEFYYELYENDIDSSVDIFAEYYDDYEFFLEENENEIIDKLKELKII